MLRCAKRILLWTPLVALAALPSLALAVGGAGNDSFSKSKRVLAQKVYFDHRITMYCSAPYDERGTIDLPEGFTSSKYHHRAKRMEWEHIVPAESLGRTFPAWKEGDPLCVNTRGKPFKGRSCAERASTEYRSMQADMHNLAPAIGAVNAARQNYAFDLLPDAQSSFGSCPVKIEGRRVEPPAEARGIIARSYLYIQAEYPRYQMSRPQQRLMEAWDMMYPPDQWECVRAERIAAIQGNSNRITEARCGAVGF